MKSGFIGLVAAAMLGGAAQAAPIVVINEALPSERVSVADVNLYSAAGLATARTRISGAARNVCDEGAGFRPLKESIAIRTCYRGALSDGLRQLDAVRGALPGSAAVAATLTISAR